MLNSANKQVIRLYASTSPSYAKKNRIMQKHAHAIVLCTKLLLYYPILETNGLNTKRTPRDDVLWWHSNKSHNLLSCWMRELDLVCP